MKKLLLTLAIFLGLVVPAAAQNTQCANRPAGDSTNACANTRFVQGAINTSGFINPISMGAVCSGPSASAAINAALTQAAASNTGVILTCNFNIGARIVVPDGVMLTGTGHDSGLTALAGVNDLLVTGGSSSIISNFSIDGNYTNQAAGRGGVTFRTSSVGFVVHNMRIVNSRDSAISVNSGSSRGTFSGNFIDRVFAAGTGASQGPGIDVNNGAGGAGTNSNMLVIGNTIRNVDSGHIAANSTIDGFYVYSNIAEIGNPTGTSVHIGDNVTAYDENNNNIVIVGNALRASGNNGIHVGGNNVTISGNEVVSSAQRGIIHASFPNGNPTLSQNVTITGNNIYAANNDGLAIQNATNYSITGNIVTNPNGFGILSDFGSTQGTISGNSVRGSADTGIVLNNGCSNIVVDSNTIANAAVNHGMRIGVNGTACADITVTNNRFVGNNSRAIVEGNATVRSNIANNNVRDNTGSVEQISLLTTSGSRSVNNVTQLAQFNTVALTVGGSVDLGAANDYVVISGDAAALTITDLTPKWPGREVKLRFIGANSVAVQNSTPIFLSSSFASNTASSDSVLTLVSDGTLWYETSRRGETQAQGRTALGLGTIATQNANAVAITGGSITGVTGGARTLCISGVQQSITGVIGEQIAATCSVPANVMGLNGRLRATVLTSNNNSANAKTFRMRWGAAGAGVTGSVLMQISNTTNLSIRQQAEVQNRNSVSSQIGSINQTTGGWGVAAGAPTATAVNTANAAEIVFTVDLANAADTGSIETYLVELITP